MVEIRERNSDTLCAEIVLGASHISAVHRLVIGGYRFRTRMLCLSLNMQNLLDIR